MTLVSTEIPYGGGARLGGDEGRNGGKRGPTLVPQASEMTVAATLDITRARLSSDSSILAALSRGWRRLDRGCSFPHTPRALFAAPAEGGGGTRGSDQRVSDSNTGVMMEKENHPEYRLGPYLLPTIQGDTPKIGP